MWSRLYSYSGNVITNHEYEIKSAFIVVANDGQLILDMLKNIALNKVKPIKGNSQYTDKYQASTLYQLITNLSAGQTTENGAIYNVSNMSTGSLLNGISSYISQFESLLLRYYGYVVNERTLAYKVIDAFEYYKNSVHYNFYGNIINANDLVIVQSILTEHAEPQENLSYTDTFWGSRIIWTADKPLTYYKNTKVKFDSSVNKGTYSLESSNDYQNIQTTSKLKVDVNENTWEKIGREWAGFLNATDKYKGTYLRMVIGRLYLSVEDFCDPETTKVNAYIEIDNSVNKRIVSQLFNYTDPPILNQLFGAAVTALTTTLAIMSGPVGAIFIAGGYLIFDNIGEHSIIDNLMNVW